MIRSLYSAASGMEAQERKMDTISNNLANVSTVGFKKTRADFEDVLYETVRGAQAPDPQGGTNPVPIQVGLGVRTAATTRLDTIGELEHTANQYDVAITGQGYLKVIRPSGEFAYTKAGNLRVDAMGRLVTQRGDQIDGNISIPQDATRVTIDQAGKVTAVVGGNTEKEQELGQIRLTLFTNPAGLEAIGGNLLLPNEAAGQAMEVKPGEMGSGALEQGYLETSNVKAVEEMVEMISTQRAYELNSKVIQTADQMLQRLTQLR